MALDQRHLVILAGPNGAGKTTVSSELLKGAYRIDAFVNADTIARGVSASSPEAVARAASRIMPACINELASLK